MSLPPAISVNNVSKAYRIWETPAARLTAPLMDLGARGVPGAGGRWLKEKARRSYRDFWALKDISFEVGKGEAVGIIGRNGSGKSTLLQLIVGTLQPTIGDVRVQGRVAALLELGSGFNPEFTGRENVYLNAAVLGFSRPQVDERFAEIVAFAEIGDFIDQPVKTYSSGMMLRLAFAVQTTVDPDILIIDEALSVGDFFFQQKCATRMRALRERGTTLLFVSHDMATVRDLCQRAIYLRKGEAAYFGASQEGIARYYAEDETRTTPVKTASVPTGSEKSPAPNFSAETFRARSLWWAEPAPAATTQDARLLGFAVLDKAGSPALQAPLGRHLRLQILFQAGSHGAYHAALELKNRYDQIVASISSYSCGLDAQKLAPGDSAMLEFDLQLNFEAGRYSCQVILASESAQSNRASRLDVSPWLGPLEIQWDYENERAPFLGMFGPPVQARFHPA